MRLLTFAVVSIGVIASASAQINSNTISSFDNATVQPAGPRSGVNGKRFLNVEGNNNGSFASYGVVDFNGGLINFAGPISSVTSLTIDLFQSNSSFTANGLVRFYLTSDTTTNIQPGTSPLFFDAGNLPGGIAASQLNTKYLLGTGTFEQVANADLDRYTFSVSGAASTFLTNAVNNNTNIRILLAPDEPGVAATWGGGDNFSGIPALTLAAQPVPEPATLAALGVGALALIRRRRK